MRILLVEDEEILSAAVAKGLKQDGYAIDVAYDGEEALYQYEVNDYDLIVLDLNIPIIDGIDVLKKIRSQNQTIKILILSARTSIGERILGLDEGANDYLTKPFDFGELEARIRNLLRREFIQIPNILKSGKLSMDTNAKRVCWENNPLALSPKEYGILEYMLQNKNQIISAERLIEHVWNNEFDPFSNTLRYHMHTLKRKLGCYSTDEMIKTVRGQGYLIEEDDK